MSVWKNEHNCGVFLRNHFEARVAVLIELTEIKVFSVSLGFS